MNTDEARRVVEAAIVSGLAKRKSDGIQFVCKGREREYYAEKRKQRRWALTAAGLTQRGTKRKYKLTQNEQGVISQKD